MTDEHRIPKCMKTEEHAAFTNRLLYQLSYVGLFERCQSVTGFLDQNNMSVRENQPRQWPDDQLFVKFVGELIARAQNGGRRVRAFGELVALLWARGDVAATHRRQCLIYARPASRHCGAIWHSSPNRCVWA
jgi:hypothetical protein